MAEFYKLLNQIKHYEWGSSEWIPRLMGVANNDLKPWAEMWMGTHPAGPSAVMLGSGETGLGERFGDLPFLFKLLAAERPLSIQAHPNLAQAQAGFERENRAGIPIDAPSRSYKDANHKPEIICALTPFSGMCGFREPAEIKRLLAAFLAPAAPAALCEYFAPALASLDSAESGAGLRFFLTALFGLSVALREELTAYILKTMPLAVPSGIEWALVRRFAELYPNDPAVIAPLYLNVFRLEPGEAVFLPAGILHAYIHGLGVELMANSDNVLRGGLTSKHVDLPELMRVLEFCPMKPELIKPPSGNICFRYPSACREFSLVSIRGGGEKTVFAEKGPAICVVARGEVRIAGKDGGRRETILKPGESIFIPAGSRSPLQLSGSYTLYAAVLPQNSADETPR